MSYVTSIGLDVHARSITAAAFNPFTGEIKTKRFEYSAGEVAAWIHQFEKPKAVYESGVTGYDLQRSLKELGVECVICATSKTQRPSADAKKKNDENDAMFLARLLATHNITEVFVPDKECEAMHDLVRAHDDIRADLTRDKLRLNMFLIRHGYVFNEKNDNGSPKKNWTRAHWEQIRKIEFNEEADNDTLALYISEVRHMEKHKQYLEDLIRKYARSDRWKSRVEGLMCLKGIDVFTAFALVVEAQAFSRFKSAAAYSSWLGLVPSERSSGERTSHGGITKTGNALCRRLLIEAAWHYSQASESRKQAPSDSVSLAVQNHAAKGVKRLVRMRKHLRESNKKPVVANTAIARELACFVWAIGCMCEGTLKA